MSIKQLVDLFVKGSWSAEQKGALAWEIEVVTEVTPNSLKYSRLFWLRCLCWSGGCEGRAACTTVNAEPIEQRFGGRCDPLSKLVLVAKQLKTMVKAGVARQLLEKMYSTAAVLSNPTLYSDGKSQCKLLRQLGGYPCEESMHDTSMKVWRKSWKGAKRLP